MALATANGIQLDYETYGDPDDPALLLVMGLGAQMVSWELDFVQAFVDRGFHVIRFDNRDVGRSTIFSQFDDLDLMDAVTKGLNQEPIDAPYLLSDMAADAAGLLDVLGIERAHVVGASMGGMIVQTMAIEQRHKLLSLTSIMSTTGDPDVGRPRPEILPVLLEAAPAEREAYIESCTETSRVIGSPEHFEEDRVRARHAAAFDRGYHRMGVGRQLVAILASGSRSAALREVDINTVVIHGDQDPLIDVSGGERTAEVIPGAELLLLDGMGHDLPTFYWPPVIEAVTDLAVRSSALA